MVMLERPQLVGERHQAAIPGREHVAVGVGEGFDGSAECGRVEQRIGFIRDQA